MRITSLQNDTIKMLVKLGSKKNRDASGMFLVEGEHLLQEAKASGLLEKSIGIGTDYDLEITEHIAEKLSTTKSGSTVFGLVRKPDYKHVKGSRYLLCDGIQDPGNLGTMIRTAHSFGFDALYLSESCVDEYNDKVIRATQGALFHMPVLRGNLVDMIQGLQSDGVSVYSTYLGNDTVGLASLDAPKLAIVMGSEGNGVSDSVVQASNGTVKIETSQFESLNVAIATGIVCYALRK